MQITTYCRLGNHHIVKMIEEGVYPAALMSMIAEKQGLTCRPTKHTYTTATVKKTKTKTENKFIFKKYIYEMYTLNTVK